MVSRSAALGYYHLAHAALDVIKDIFDRFRARIPYLRFFMK